MTMGSEGGGDQQGEQQGEQAIITGEASKLPAKWAAIVDVAQPLPGGVTFFERRVVMTDLIWNVGLALLFAILGVICVPMGIAFVWSDRTAHGDNSSSWYVIGFGVVMLFAAWMCLMAVPAQARIMAKQKAGDPTRLGVFIDGDEVMIAGDGDYTIVPRSQCDGIDGSTFKYTFKAQPKTLKLPTQLMRDDPRTMLAALERWKAK